MPIVAEGCGIFSERSDIELLGFIVFFQKLDRAPGQFDKRSVLKSLARILDAIISDMKSIKNI